MKTLSGTTTTIHYQLIASLYSGTKTPASYNGGYFETEEEAYKVWLDEYKNRKKNDGYDEK